MAALDPAAGGVGEELGAQADAEQRGGGGHGLGHQGAGARQPGGALVLPGGRRAAEHDDPAEAARVGGQLVAAVGAADVELGGGLEVRAEPAETGVRLVLDDEDARAHCPAS